MAFTEPSRSIDVHKVVTTLFNPRFNKFISKYYFNNENAKFSYFAHILDEFRDRLYLNALNGLLDVNNFKQEIEKLINFYLRIEQMKRNGQFTEREIEELTDLLTRPFIEFISDIDKILGSSFASIVQSSVAASATSRYGSPTIQAKSRKEVFESKALPRSDLSRAQRFCPRCGSRLFYLRTIKRYYCFTCKKYVS